MFTHSVVWGALAGLTIILCAVYMLRMYQKSMLGKPEGDVYLFADLTKSEWPAMIILTILVLSMGVYPQWVMDLTKESTQNIIKIINETAIIG